MKLFKVSMTRVTGTSRLFILIPLASRYDQTCSREKRNKRAQPASLSRDDWNFAIAIDRVSCDRRCGSRSHSGWQGY
jgi:hypothetical protein